MSAKEQKGTKPDCFQCGHRRAVLGSAHSRCAHPIVAQEPKKTMLEFAAMLGGGGMPDVECAEKLGIKAHAHGIRMGWFAWPFNFDPTWLQACNGFTKKTVEAKETP